MRVRECWLSILLVSLFCGCHCLSRHSSTCSTPCQLGAPGSDGPRTRPGMGLPLRALGLAAGVAAVFAALVRRLHTLQVELEQAQAESSRQMKLRSEERAGRTKVERKLREQSRAPAAEASTAHSYSPIGYLTSCYVERRGTPRQGCLVPSARAQLKVSSQTVQAVAALDGLAQFSHVWLVYDFHQNTTTADKPQVRAKVHPPALGGAKLGLFATRTPHRPNAIGLTVARLLGVRGDTLLLGGADLVDGTPVRAALQSVRPSSPCLAGAACGARRACSQLTLLWPRRCSTSSRTCGTTSSPTRACRAGASPSRPARSSARSTLQRARAPRSAAACPGCGCARSPSTRLTRTRTRTRARTRTRTLTLTLIRARARARALALTRYEDEATVRDVIVQTLLLDIRSVHQGRGEVAAGQQYHVRIDQLDISFETYESHVLVTGCQLRSTWRVDA